MARDYFYAHYNYLTLMETLDDAARGRLFTACLMYASEGIEPVGQGDERYVFPTIKAQIDIENAKDEKLSKTLTENAQKRWANSTKPTAAVSSEPQEKLPRTAPKAFPHTADAYMAAKYLDGRIRERIPTKPVATEAILQSWARDINNINRIDKQSWDDIDKVLQFSQSDSFWSQNIMSGSKLRKQFFVLLGKVQMASG